jgi:hypothetical protein
MAQEITNGLISRYTFANGSLVDAVTGNNLTNSNATQVADRCNTASNAYSFNGTTTQLLSRTGATGVTGSQYSYCAWVRVVALPNNASLGTIISVGGAGADQFLAVNNNYVNNTVSLIAYNYNSTGNVFASTPLTENIRLVNGIARWIFVCATRTNGALALYVDGQLMTTTTVSGTPTYQVSNITIGARHTPGTIHAFNGNIDDVRIYNRALTACEIAQLYRQNPTTQTNAISLNITGNVSICPNTEHDYSITRQFNPCTFTPQPSASVITWSVPAGATIVSGQGTEQVRVRFGENVGSVSVTERVGNDVNCVVSSSINVTTLGSITSTLPNSVLCANYNQTLSVGNALPTTWSVVSGTLPTGLSLSSGGVVSGVPTQTGTFTFTIRASQASGCAATMTYSVTISCPTISIAPTSLPNGTICAAYSQQLTATAINCVPNTWSIVPNTGTLPIGLSLSSSGLISGSTSVTGTFSFGVQVNAGTCSAVRTFSLVISCPVVNITPATLPNGTTNVAYPTQQFTQTGLICGTPNWALIAGTLPNGLTFSNGTLSGTPTQAGTFTLTVRVNDGVCECAQTKTYTFTINAPCVNVPINLSNSQVTLCSSYSGALSQTFFNPANGNITWSSNNLPSWLTLNPSTGVLTKIGDPTNTSPISLNVAVTQNGVSSCPQNITINLSCPTNIVWSTNALNWSCQNPNVNTQISVNACTQVTWSVTGLPAGWAINPSTGVITGTGNAQMSSVTAVVTANIAGCGSFSKTYYGYNTSGTPPPASGGFTICPMEYFPVQFYIPEGATQLRLLSQSPYNVLMFGWCVDGCSGSGSISTNWATYNVVGGTTITIMAQIAYAGTFNFLIETANDCGIVSEQTIGQATGVCEIYGVCNTCNPWGGGDLFRSSNQKTVTPLQITPNPVANDLKLSGDTEMEYEVRLQDAQGKQIASYTGKLAEIEREMNKQMRNLKADMYFVLFKSREGKIEVKKFVKVN